MATATTAHKGFAFYGGEVLVQFLTEFPKGVEANVLNQAASEAVKKAFIPNIKKNIKGVVKKRSGNLLKGVASGKVPGMKAGNYRAYMTYPACHTHLIERGTKQRRLPRRIAVLFVQGTGKRVRGMQWASVTKTGRGPKRKFFEPAVSGSDRAEAGRVMVEGMKKRMGSFIAKEKAKAKY